jgi:hypothetical protein
MHTMYLGRTHLTAALLAVMALSSAGCKKKAPNAWKLPVDAKQLPSNTTVLEAETVEGARETDPRLRDVFTAAELGAEICREGAIDPAHELEVLSLLGASSAKKFFKADNLEQVRLLMECGAVLGQSLETQFQTAIGFVDDSGAKAEVDVLQLKLTDLPPKYGLTKRSFGALDGFCRTSDPAKPGVTVECTTHSEAALKQGNSWFIGKRGELDQISKTIATPRAELSTQLAALNDAANELEGLSSSRIEAQLTTAKPFLAAPCAWGAFQSAGKTDEFLQGCFPTSDEKTIQDIDAKLRAAAFEIEPDVLKQNAVHGGVVLVARDDDSAKIVEKDANDLVVDWKAQLENNDAKLAKQAKANPVSLRQRSWAIIVDNFSRALQKTKVTRAGRVVKMQFNEPLAADDVRDLTEARKDATDQRGAVADILAAIQGKQAVPVAALTKLVGPQWATYLVAESTWDPKNLPPECTAKKPAGKKAPPPDPRCVAPVEPPAAQFGAGVKVAGSK